MKTYLQVPFRDKDRAKSLGARYDMARKLWFVPDGIDFWCFSEWLPDDVQSFVKHHPNLQ
jgi:exodeoxyribonuclease VII large subunit